MNLLQRAKSVIREHRHPRRMAAALAGVVALGGLITTLSLGTAYAAAPASATFSPGSSAANAQSTWTVGFTTSSSGALGASDTISVVFNSSFILAGGQSVTFGGFGACPAADDLVNANVVTVALAAGCGLGNAASGTLEIHGITNPAAGTYANTSFAVATSKDTAATSTGASIVIGAASGNDTSTTLTTSPNPTPPLGTMTLGATVAPTSATGTVTFFDNGTPIAGCVAIGLSSAHASCTTGYNATGNTSYVAVYSGDSSLSGSTSAAVVPVAETETHTSIMLRKGSDFYAKETRQRITVKVTTVNGAPATIAGDVKAMAGRQVLCTITLVDNGGRCTLSARELGGHHTYRIYAVYTGSTIYATSTSDNQLYRIIG